MSGRQAVPVWWSSRRVSSRTNWSRSAGLSGASSSSWSSSRTWSRPHRLLPFLDGALRQG
ncbi:hypothetical protein ACFC5Z_07050 [Streptomyces sp. NPDC056004]|uniref:hypothetical protein n=1 Tax=Streptomyces sp. NPDC056004 TaxID=3345677 RepID=UPI0035DA0CBA